MSMQYLKILFMICLPFTLLKGSPPSFHPFLSTRWLHPPIIRVAHHFLRVDQTKIKKGGHEGSYVNPPLKKGGPPFFDGGWKGGKGGPPFKGGCSSIKYPLAKFSSFSFFYFRAFWTSRTRKSFSNFQVFEFFACEVHGCIFSTLFALWVR